MQINNGFLDTAKLITLLGKGSKISPNRIAIHYTAGSTLSGAISALQSQGFSYNALIDVDGTIHQARAFDHGSSHAGRSNWKATSGLTNSSSLNTTAIGISLVNLGLHDYFSAGKWWYGYDAGKKKHLPPSVADKDANKKSSIYAPKRQQHWAPYTAEQITSCRALVDVLLKEYPGLIEIVGHDDIAIDGKFDPGPDFPMQEFRDEFNKHGGLGLRANVDSPDGKLTLRDRPAHMGGQEIAILQQGDEVHIRSVTYASASNAAVLVPPSSGRALTGWASVDINRSNRHAGFVYVGYLTANPLAAALAAKL